MLKILSRNYCKQVSSNRSLTEFKWFLPFQTRWLDNDCFGHMNNAVYHGIFDSVINVFLIRHCGLDIRIGSSSRVGFMVGFFQNITQKLGVLSFKYLFLGYQ